jgi:DNA-binding SARP family transcriptional activator/Tol biopolymer transport system component
LNLEERSSRTASHNRLEQGAVIAEQDGSYLTKLNRAIMTRKASAPSSLRICLLGPFAIAVDGVPVEEYAWQRPQPKLLVQLLSLHPHHQLHREEIMDLLWPEHDPTLAAQNLSKAIYMARRALEPGLAKGARSHFIFTQNHQVLLRAPERLWIDADEFESHARDAIRQNDAAACEEALALHRGNLLADNPYVDWATARREHLRLLHRKLLTKLAQLCEEQGEYQRGIKHLQGLVKDDPLDERAHRELMRLLALAGSKFLALEQYKQCRETVRQELGAAPEPKTIELGRQILHGEIQPSPLKTQNKAPTFTRLTFRRGIVHAARLTSDGQGVVYAAAWDRNRLELFLQDVADNTTRALGLSDANILSVLPDNHLAVSCNYRFLRGYINAGTLTRARFDTDERDEILADVQWADYLPGQREAVADESPGGEGFLLVRDKGGLSCLEFPPGNVLHRTGGWVSHPRFSPRGDLIAFLDHPHPVDDSGAVMVTDFKGEKRTLSTGWISVQGLAWSAHAEEVWFTATASGNSRALYAVNLSGEVRLVNRVAGSLTLHDISRSGRVLLTRDNTQIGMMGLVPGETDERDLTWLDWSLGRDLSDDGQTLLFTEAGEGSGMEYGVFLRNIKDSTVRRLGDGSALALSPSQEWALVRTRKSHSQLMLLPTGKGEAKPLEDGGVNHQPWASWFPDGRRVLFVGNEEGSGSRLYIQDLNGGQPRAIESVPEGAQISSTHSISPDGKLIAAINPDQSIRLYPSGGGAPRLVAGVLPMEVPIRWSQDGQALYVFDRGKMPASIYRIELASGERTFWKELMPPDPVGVHEMLRILLTPDLRGYAYTYTRDLSELYLVEGLQ